MTARDGMRKRRRPRAFHLVVLAVVACGTEKATAPEDSVPTGSADAELIVSAPIARAALPGAGDSSGTVVFISAMPQAVPGAVHVVVHGKDGEPATAELADGGFDPVAVAAANGDVVTATLTYPNGETISQELAVRTRRPPRVVRTSPGPHRTDVPLNAVIRVVFSAPVNLESAREGILLTTGSGGVVSGTIESDGVVAVKYVITAGTLAPETTYRLDVTTDVRDVLGQALAEPVSVEFRTGTTSEDPRLAPGGLAVLSAPTRINLVRGGNGQAKITISRGEAFTGAVALSASGMPSGVSLIFRPARIAADSNTATIDVTVDTTVAPGTHAVVISAVGEGLRAATAKATLAIAVTAGSLSLTLAPTRIEIVQGSARSVEATIARGGTFTGGVSLSPAGFSAGVRAAYGSIGEGSTTTTLDIWVDSTAAPGTRSVTILATGGDGVGRVAATLEIAVVQPSGSVTLTIPPASTEVVRGGKPAYMEVAIARGGTFAGSVALSVIDAPPGVYVSTPLIEAGSTTALLEVVVEPSATLGTKRIVISATGHEIRSASATLLIAAVDPSGAVNLVPEQGHPFVSAGGPTVTTTIALNRTVPFAGPVELTVTGAHVTATIGPEVATGATATLSISAPPGAVNGTYPLRVDGGGTGIANASTTVWVTITDGSPAVFSFDPVTVTVTPGGPSATAALAYTGSTVGVSSLIVVEPLPGFTSSYSRDTRTVTVQAGTALTAGTYFLRARLGFMRRNPDFPSNLPSPSYALLRVIVVAAPALRQ